LDVDIIAPCPAGNKPGAGHRQRQRAAGDEQREIANPAIAGCPESNTEHREQRKHRRELQHRRGAGQQPGTQHRSPSLRVIGGEADQRRAEQQRVRPRLTLREAPIAALEEERAVPRGCGITGRRLAGATSERRQQRAREHRNRDVEPAQGKHARRGGGPQAGEGAVDEVDPRRLEVPGIAVGHPALRYHAAYVRENPLIATVREEHGRSEEQSGDQRRKDRPTHRPARRRAIRVKGRHRRVSAGG